MTQLRGLILSEDAGLTDQSLDTLTYLPNLRSLYISKNSLSDDGEFTLKMALPKCLIIRSE